MTYIQALKNRGLLSDRAASADGLLFRITSLTSRRRDESGRPLQGGEGALCTVRAAAVDGVRVAAKGSEQLVLRRASGRGHCPGRNTPKQVYNPATRATRKVMSPFLTLIWLRDDGYAVGQQGVPGLSNRAQRRQSDGQQGPRDWKGVNRDGDQPDRRHWACRHHQALGRPARAALPPPWARKLRVAEHAEPLR